jgi:polyvinyl alcohol dehydrogenase (cytochrome)
VAVDEATGALKWHTYSVAPGNNGGAVWSTPAVDVGAGRIYVGTGNAYSGTVDPQTDSILELDLNGNVLAHFQATAGDAFSTGSGGSVGPDFDFGASPNLISGGGTAMVGEGQKAGTYWLLPRNLDPAQAQSLQLGPGSALGGILGSTAYDGQNIYGPITVPGYLWSIGVVAGHLAPNWLSPGAADPVHWSPVAVSNGVVYSANSSGFLDARLGATGTLLAHLPLNALPPANPPNYTLAFGGVSVAEGMVFADTGSQGQSGSVVAFTAG